MVTEMRDSPVEGKRPRSTTIVPRIELNITWTKASAKRLSAEATQLGRGTKWNATRSQCELMRARHGRPCASCPESRLGRHGKKRREGESGEIGGQK